jgi:hypothetical protein
MYPKRVAEQNGENQHLSSASPIIAGLSTTAPHETRPMSSDAVSTFDDRAPRAHWCCSSYFIALMAMCDHHMRTLGYRRVGQLPPGFDYHHPCALPHALSSGNEIARSFRMSRVKPNNSRLVIGFGFRWCLVGIKSVSTRLVPSMQRNIEWDFQATHRTWPSRPSRVESYQRSGGRVWDINSRERRSASSASARAPSRMAAAWAPLSFGFLTRRPLIDRRDTHFGKPYFAGAAVMAVCSRFKRFGRAVRSAARCEGRIISAQCTNSSKDLVRYWGQVIQM